MFYNKLVAGQEGEEGVAGGGWTMPNTRRRGARTQFFRRTHIGSQSTHRNALKTAQKFTLKTHRSSRSKHTESKSLEPTAPFRQGLKRLLCVSAAVVTDGSELVSAATQVSRLI